MAVLVTGGAGFIGSHLVDELMATGHEVRVLDNLSEGRRENLERWVGDPKFLFVNGDIREFNLVRRMADRCTAVFHLAAMSRIQPSITDPLLAVHQNMVGTANVLEAARQGGVKRVVYSASSSAYGRKSDHWATDTGKSEQGQGHPPWGLHEELPTDCLNPYSLSKKVGEELCDVYRRLYGLSTVSLRYFNVYGPRHQEEGNYATVIAIFRRQLRHRQPMTIVGDGTQRRDFTFVSDIVRANMMAAMAWDVVGTLNVGSGRNVSINELAALIGPGKETVNIPPRLGESNVTLADTTKIRELLGWEPQVSLEQGLQLTDQYERVNGLPGTGLVT